MGREARAVFIARTEGKTKTTNKKVIKVRRENMNFSQKRRKLLGISTWLSDYTQGLLSSRPNTQGRVLEN